MFLNVRATCHELQICRATFEHLVRNGTLPVIRVGKHRRIPRAALEAIAANAIIAVQNNQATAAQV